MIKEYQVTLICGNGKYKPVSCIVKSEMINLSDTIAKKSVLKKGIEKICIKHYWTKTDLKKYGYTLMKIREYDKEKIAEDNKKRYEAIKEMKYQSGEWKRPKSKSKLEVEN